MPLAFAGIDRRDGLAQTRLIEGFLHPVHDLQRLAPRQAPRGVRRNHDHRQGPCLRLASQRPDQADAVSVRQIEIHQQGGVGPGSCGRQTLAAGGGRRRQRTRRLSSIVAQNFCRVGVILHDQQARTLGSRATVDAPTPAAGPGRRSHPRPLQTSNHSRPPWRSAISRAMARPRPVPPLARVSEPSAWANFEKIRARNASGMPEP